MDKLNLTSKAYLGQHLLEYHVINCVTHYSMVYVNTKTVPDQTKTDTFACVHLAHT